VLAKFGSFAARNLLSQLTYSFEFCSRIKENLLDQIDLSFWDRIKL
jgi:hypothetical protein